MAYADPVKARAYSRAYTKRWLTRQYRERRAAGICVYCRTPSPKFAHCLECRRERQQYYKTHIKPRAVKIANVQCACGAWCVRPTAKRCGSCSAKHANLMRWRKVAA